jgi:hypothetical protein
VAVDIAAVTRDLQSRFRLFAPSGAAPFNFAPDDPKRSDVLAIELADTEGTAKNLATPENLKVLLKALDDVTSDVLEQRHELTAGDVAKAVLLAPVGLLAGLFDEDEALESWDKRMVQWRGRLGAYHDAVDKAPPGDRQDVLWSVTAPLLLGFFGGEASKLPQQPLDAVTPFMLANQLNVDAAWKEERWELLKEDLLEGVANAAKTAGAGLGALAIAGVFVVGAVIFDRLRGR